MPTNRELFFQLLKKKNKYLTRLVIKSLLNDANGFLDEVTLYQHFDEEVPDYEELSKRIERVENGEPFQYVLGYANFIDKYFEVNSSVLIPRQETEQLVIDLKTIIEKRYGDEPISIADIGTGSGAIAVSLKKYFPKTQVTATDIDQDAIDVAASNAGRLDQDVMFIRGNMLEPLIKYNIKVDVLVSNPPYIDGPTTIDEQVWKYEPHKALLASPDTFFYEEMLKNADKVLNPGALIAFEIGEEMESSLTELVNKYMPGSKFYFAKDLYNKTRFLYIINEGENVNA